jgi:hypothetical protein
MKRKNMKRNKHENIYFGGRYMHPGICQGVIYDFSEFGFGCSSQGFVWPVGPSQVMFKLL